MTLNRLNKKQLIIVDDHKATRLYNSQLAESLNYFENIHSFESAEQALQFLESKQKTGDMFGGTMIIDVKMEGMDGLDFIDEVDQRDLADPSTRMHVLTGENTARNREKAETSAFGPSFSLKPLTEIDLTKLARAHDA